MPSSSTGTTYAERQLVYAFRTIYIRLYYCGAKHYLHNFIIQYSELLELDPDTLMAEIEPRRGWNMSRAELSAAKTEQQAWDDLSIDTLKMKTCQRYWAASSTLAGVSELLIARCRPEEGIKWNAIAEELDRMGDKAWQAAQVHNNHFSVMDLDDSSGNDSAIEIL